MKYKRDFISNNLYRFCINAYKLYLPKDLGYTQLFKVYGYTVIHGSYNYITPNELLYNDRYKHPC